VYCQMKTDTICRIVDGPKYLSWGMEERNCYNWLNPKDFNISKSFRSVRAEWALSSPFFVKLFVYVFFKALAIYELIESLQSNTQNTHLS